MKEKPHILYIDDEKENLTVFKFAFMSSYKIHVAQSAVEGLDILREQPQMSIIISDQRMPGKSGVEFLEQTRDEFPDLIRIIVTGYSDIEAVIDAINKGRVYHFVKKPWEKDEFKSILDKAYETHQLRKENKSLIEYLRKANLELEGYAKDLENKVEERTKEIKQQNTEIQKKNKELELHRNHLEQLVKERTVDLEIAKNKAEEANKLKSAFLANMSHEIRTPLNAIVGFSTLLTTDDTTPAQRNSFFNYIDKSTESLLQLVDDILDISLIEAKQLDLKITEINISNVLNEFYKLYSEPIMEESNEKVKLLINFNNVSENTVFKVDEVRYKQILSNFVSNAKKYTTEGIIEIGVKLNNENGTQKLITYVKDTGIGIAEGDRDVVFERFRKIESTGHKLYRGAGLGLSICKSLVSMMKGEIWLESELNKGSVFYFALPFPEVGKITSKEFKQMDSLVKHEVDLSDKTILIAEDEETNYLLINTILRNTGITLLWAQDGSEVVQMAKDRSDIDLILMDIKLPKKSGIEAIKEIKEFRNIRIVAQTAYAMQSDIQKIMATGCDDFIAKPFTKKRFIDKIMQNL